MKAYQFLFYTLLQVFEISRLDNLSKAKATLVISALEAFVLEGMLIEVFLFLHWGPNGSIPISIIIVGLGITWKNYQMFEAQDRWRRYAEEFDKYSGWQLFVGRVLVLAAIAGVMTFGFLVILHARRVWA